jgi:hypothetical protein
MSGLHFWQPKHHTGQSRIVGFLNSLRSRLTPGVIGVLKMSITTVLKVFKNSSLIISQGEFKIERVFSNGKAANKARYFYYCTDNGVEIFSHRNKAGNSKFAAVGK